MSETANQDPAAQPAMPPEVNGADTPARVNQWDIVAKQFRKNRAAVWGLRVSFVLVLLAFFAPALACGMPFVWRGSGDASASYPWLVTLMNRGVWPQTLDRLFNLGMVLIAAYAVLAVVLRIMSGDSHTWRNRRATLRKIMGLMFVVLGLAHALHGFVTWSMPVVATLLILLGLATLFLYVKQGRTCSGLTRSMAWGGGLVAAIYLAVLVLPFLSDRTGKADYRTHVTTLRDAHDIERTLPILEKLLGGGTDLGSSATASYVLIRNTMQELESIEGEASLAMAAQLEMVRADLERASFDANGDATRYVQRQLASVADDEEARGELQGPAGALRPSGAAASADDSAGRSSQDLDISKRIGAALTSLGAPQTRAGTRVHRKLTELKSVFDEHVRTLPSQVAAAFKRSQSETIRLVLELGGEPASENAEDNDALRALGLPTREQARAYTAHAQEQFDMTTRVMPHIPYGYDDQLPRKYDRFCTCLTFDRGERHYLGTDEQGRDIMSRMLYGLRIGLTIGIVAVSIYILIGTIMGALAGFFRGRVDMLIMRLVEMMLCIPGLFLILTIVTLFENRSIFTIMLAIGVVSWTGVTRLVRGEFLRERNREYVTAAQAMGYSTPRIIFRHILPNAISPVLVVATFGIVGAILTESGLSFLGLGDPTVPSWGGVLDHGRKNYYWHLILPPSVAIFITVTALNLVGDGLRDALDPKLRD